MPLSSTITNDKLAGRGWRLVQSLLHFSEENAHRLLRFLQLLVQAFDLFTRVLIHQNLLGEGVLIDGRSVSFQGSSNFMVEIVLFFVACFKDLRKIQTALIAPVASKLFLCFFCEIFHGCFRVLLWFDINQLNFGDLELIKFWGSCWWFLQRSFCFSSFSTAFRFNLIL